MVAHLSAARQTTARPARRNRCRTRPRENLASSPEFNQAHCTWWSAKITGMRSWIAAAMRLGAASHVSSATLCTQRPCTFAGVQSEENANGMPPSTWKKNDDVSFPQPFPRDGP
jgi:hypothetical protein